MKIKRIIVIIVICVFSLLANYAYSQDVIEIMTKSREATRSLDTAKTKGKTMTGSVYIMENKGVIDYGNRKFSIIQSQGDVNVSSIYFMDGVTYMYNGMLDNWIKFGEDLGIFGNILDKEKLFSFFPIDLEGTGFKMEIIGEEKVEGQLCYILVSRIVDKKLAKKFIMKLLNNFVSEQVLSQLSKDSKARDAYIEQYVNSAESTQWISKDNFFVMKIKDKNEQSDGQGGIVSLENEAIYYDFNQSVTIELPSEAIDAKLITVQDLGMANQ